jgi:spermidine/putrescine transport system permease protein
MVICWRCLATGTTFVFSMRPTSIWYRSAKPQHPFLPRGANHLKTFWRVTLPSLRVSLIAAALLIFTLSLDEIAVSFFLIGPDNTIPLEIWSRLRRGITPEINAISTLILLFSISTIVVWHRLRTRRESAAETSADL